MAPFHLCQPGAGASCGACCGMFNLADASRPAVTEVLARQTEAVRPTPRNQAAFSEVARALSAQQPPAMFAEVRVCPLLGFLDVANTRVGCLAHPTQTGGVDLRDCGVYHAALCERFECPSFLWLTDAQARLVRAACPDWFLYSLVVTDVELVRGCLRLIENALGAAIAPDLLALPPAVDAMRALFELRLGPAAERTFGRFVAIADRTPELRTIDYATLDLRTAPEDDVVVCLGGPLSSASDVCSARERVRARVRAVVGALSP
jgi:hypothetical protein